jgi:hypothetical protein
MSSRWSLSAITKDDSQFVAYITEQRFRKSALQLVRYASFKCDYSRDVFRHTNVTLAGVA